MHSEPEPAVINWFEGIRPEDLYFSSVSEAELRRGVGILPEGRLRNDLGIEIDAIVAVDFAGRVLPFDSVAAVFFARIFVQRRSLGRPTDFQDCQIASIAMSRGMAIATRNIKDFEGVGLEIVNPWVST